MQTRSLAEVHAVAWNCPDGHGPEQATVTIHVQTHITNWMSYV